MKKIQKLPIHRYIFTEHFSNHMESVRILLQILKLAKSVLIKLCPNI